MCNVPFISPGSVWSAPPPPHGLARRPACHCVPLTPHRHRRLVCFTVVFPQGDCSYLFDWNIEGFQKEMQMVVQRRPMSVNLVAMYHFTLLTSFHYTKTHAMFLLIKKKELDRGYPTVMLSTLFLSWKVYLFIYLFWSMEPEYGKCLLEWSIASAEMLLFFPLLLLFLP